MSIVFKWITLSKLKLSFRARIHDDSAIFFRKILRQEFRKDSSVVEVKFKTKEIFPRIRRRQFTSLDLLSYIGGSLGLLIGFSVLSLIEICYFFTIKIWFDKVQQRKVTPLNVQGESQKRFQKLFKVTHEFPIPITYFDKSSIHGLRFLSDDKRHICEKLFWIVSFAAAMAMSFLSIQELYVRYINNPIIITMDGKMSSTNDVRRSMIII